MTVKDKYSNGEFKKLYEHFMNQGFYFAGWNKRYNPILNNIDSMLDKYSQIFEYFTGMNVLDIGCFSGFFSFLISDYANKVIGIDIQEDTISFADILNYKLNPGNVEFKLKSFSKFVNEKQHTDLNINACLFHKVIGQFNENDIEVLCDFVKGIKILISGSYFEKFKFLKKKKLHNTLYLYENMEL